MSEPRKITINIIRDGKEPRDESWKDISLSERIEMVWTLTKLCMAWNNRWTGDEQRLQRTVTRLQRRERRVSDRWRSRGLGWSQYHLAVAGGYVVSNQSRQRHCVPTRYRE